MAILAFHNIDTKFIPGITNYHPRRFKKLIFNLFSDGFEFAGLDDYLEQKNSERLISLTFDDGMDNFYTGAYPVLADQNIPATIFIPVDYIGQTASWDYISYFKQSNHLSEVQIRDIISNKITIGSHGLTHRSLTSTSGRLLKYELSRSKEILEDKTGRTIKHISYPFGRFNGEIEKEAMQAGYTHGFAITDRQTDFTQPRQAVYSIDTHFSIKHKILPGPVNRLERYKGRIINSLSGGTILLNRLRGY